MAKKDIILGNGTFYIGTTAVGITRGGGQFTVERTYRDITADGDRGSIKDRIAIDESRAKLKMNLLEIVQDNLPKMYPGTVVENGVFTAKKDIETVDYNTVKWAGKTKGGKEVLIELKNAINKENIDWTLADKDEIIASLTYEACYDDEEESEEVEPWKVTFVA